MGINRGIVLCVEVLTIAELRIMTRPAPRDRPSITSLMWRKDRAEVLNRTVELSAASLRYHLIRGSRGT